jgi:uncharacterized protein
MKIGIISDTHRNTEYLITVVDWLIKRHRISSVFHLGDDYDDSRALTEKYIEVVQVPGIYDQGYREQSLPKKLTETIQGLNIFLVHTLEKDATKEDLIRSDIILHGHTHKYEIRLEDGLLYVNPGHCKGPLDKNAPPSFGLLDIQDKNVNVKIFSLDFKVLQEMSLVRSENRLFKM